MMAAGTFTKISDTKTLKTQKKGKTEAGLGGLGEEGREQSEHEMERHEQITEDMRWRGADEEEG